MIGPAPLLFLLYRITAHCQAFCPQKPPLTEGKVSTGVRVMSYFGGNSLSQNLTVLPAPSMREPEAPSPRGLPPVRRLGRR